MKMTVPPAPARSRSAGDTESDEASCSGSASAPEDDVHRRKYQLLLERCEVLQQDNERIVNRIHEAKKITKRYKKDVRLLMERLDRHGDGYMNATGDADARPAVGLPHTVKPLLRTEQSGSGKSSEKPSSIGKKPVKRKNTKGEKSEKDPNAPKKPCNAFFQYCQEQRPVVVAESGGDTGLPELSKQEVTKQLASRWRALSVDDKKVYVAMFERSKEKYAVEMSAYIRKDTGNL